MGAPMKRTAQLIRDEITEIRAIFGDSRNAYTRLALNQTDVTYTAFARAMIWEPSYPHVVATIRAHMKAWKRQHLQNPLHSGPLNLTQLPEVTA